ncbi:MAG: hypothetical protein RR478_03870 [Bacilli bacterium]
MKKLFLILLVIVISFGSVFMLITLKYKISNETSLLPLMIKKEYYCPADYELTDKKCYKTDNVSITRRYYCDTGYLQGNNCVVETIYPTHIEDDCPNGYTLSGFKCIKSGTSINYSKCNSFDMTYSFLTEMCYPEIESIKFNKCYFGELIGNKCIDIDYTQAKYVNTCPSGYDLNLSTCEKEIIIPAYKR